MTEGPDALKKHLDRICAEAEKAVDEGTAIIILSDWDIDAGHAPIPMLLATGADVNAADKAGATPLGLARRAGQAEVEALLVGHGARD